MENVFKKCSLCTAIILLLLLVFPSLNSVSAETIDGPCIEFKESEHDFGEVTQGGTPRHTFTFKNTGNQKLVIEKVKAG